MNRLLVIIITAVVSLSFLAFENAWAQNRILLGERHVTDRSDRDTIHVGAKHGKFSGLSTRVTGAAVEFKRVVVHFENGSEQVFEKNRVIKKGDGSGRIDLEGGDRLIDKVVFYYEARSKGWKGADIKLFGIR